MTNATIFIDKYLKEIPSKTQTIYYQHYKQLHNKLEIELDVDDINWLNNTDKVVSNIVERSIPTQKHILMCLLNISFNGGLPKKTLHTYRDILVETNEYSNKRSETCTTMEKLHEIANTLNTDAITSLLTKDYWRADDYNKYQQLLISKLYTLIPPKRNNYSYMKIIITNNTIPQSKYDSQGDCLVFDKDTEEMYFIIDVGKPLNKFGTQRIEIPKELHKLLLFWLKKRHILKKDNNTNYLLINSKGKALSKNSLTKYISSIFGESVSCNSIRKQYYYEKYN